MDDESGRGPAIEASNSVPADCCCVKRQADSCLWSQL
jgi:hypothetical protein